MKNKLRPRANSAPSVAALGTKDRQLLLRHICPYHRQHRPLQNGTGHRLNNGFAVAHVPIGQPLNLSHLSVIGGRRLNQKRRTLSKTFSISQDQKENIELRCCRINVLLVTMQLCLGAMVTAVAFYMKTLTSSLRTRECPYWAGIPLLATGSFGVYFCATELTLKAKTIKTFLIKGICFFLSASCVFLCMVACVFPGFIGSKIARLVNCNMTDTKCVCAESQDPRSHLYIYEDIDSCETLITSVKDYLILQCSLNAIASGVCFWFVTLLWKSRYNDDIHPGLRIYSYNGSIHSQYLEYGLEQCVKLQDIVPPSPLIGNQNHAKR